MSTPVTRRTFLIGAAGAAAAGWVWLRDSGLKAEPVAAGPATSTSAVPATTGVSVTPPTTATATSTTATTTTATTTPPAAQIEALCRAAWGAQEPTGAYIPHKIERLTVHHTARFLGANREAPGAIRGHQRFHQVDRGWVDIAYHFMIDMEGNLYECRPYDAAGDTATSYDPTGHLLVCCEGDFNVQELPEAQRETLVAVLAWAATEFDVGTDTIRGHRDFAGTTCPGDNVYSLIESGDLAASVDSLMAAGGVELEIICGPLALRRVASIEA